MIGDDKTRIAVYVEKALRDRLGLMRDRWNGERGMNVSESKFLGMCLSEYVNANRDRWGGVRISDGDKDFD
jgi:hypothetical protein